MSTTTLLKQEEEGNSIQEIPFESNKAQEVCAQMVVNVIPKNFKSTLPPRKRAKTQEEKEQRRIERILRNRKAAHKSRERKRQQLSYLHKKCGKLMSIMNYIDSLNLKEIDQNEKIQEMYKDLYGFIGENYDIDDDFSTSTSTLTSTGTSTDTTTTNSKSKSKSKTIKHDDDSAEVGTTSTSIDHCMDHPDDDEDDEDEDVYFDSVSTSCKSLEDEDELLNNFHGLYKNFDTNQDKKLLTPSSLNSESVDNSPIIYNSHRAVPTTTTTTTTTPSYVSSSINSNSNNTNIFDDIDLYQLTDISLDDEDYLENKQTTQNGTTIENNIQNLNKLIKESDIERYPAVITVFFFFLIFSFVSYHLQSDMIIREEKEEEKIYF